MRFLQLLFSLLFPLSLFAANPAFTDFNNTQFAVPANKISIKNGVPFTNGVAYTSFTVLSTNPVTHFGGAADATNGFLMRVKYIDATNYVSNGSNDCYVGIGTNQPFTLPNGTNVLYDGRIITVVSATNNGSILVTNANGVQLIAEQQSLLIPGGQTVSFAWLSSVGKWAAASLQGLLSSSNYWTGPQTFAGTVTAGSATFTNPVFINPVSLTNAAIVSSTNYGTLGETNYTWTDANGWWHTNTGSKTWAHLQNGLLTLSNGVTGVQFKTPTNSPTATATNLVATSTSGDTAWMAGTASTGLPDPSTTSGFWDDFEFAGFANDRFGLTTSGTGAYADQALGADAYSSILSNAVGVLKLSTGSTTSGSAYGSTRNSMYATGYRNVTTNEIRFCLLALPSQSDAYQFKIGYNELSSYWGNTTLGGSMYLWINTNSSTFQFVTSTGTSVLTNDTTLTAQANVWYVARMMIDSNTNGICWISTNRANLGITVPPVTNGASFMPGPNKSLNLGFGLVKTGGSVGTTPVGVYLDYCGFGVTYANPR